MDISEIQGMCWVGGVGLGGRFARCPHICEWQPCSTGITGHVCEGMRCVGRLTHLHARGVRV